MKPRMTAQNDKFGLGEADMNATTILAKLSVLLVATLLSIGALAAGEPVSFMVTIPWHAYHGDTHLREGRYLVVMEDFNERQCDAQLYSASEPKTKSPIATVSGFCKTEERESARSAIEIFTARNNRALVVLFETPNRLSDETIVVLFSINRDVP